LAIQVVGAVAQIAGGCGRKGYLRTARTTTKMRCNSLDIHFSSLDYLLFPTLCAQETCTSKCVKATKLEDAEEEGAGEKEPKQNARSSE
jgi:hypothetical protein